jgi:hypothetical protein
VRGRRRVGLVPLIAIVGLLAVALGALLVVRPWNDTAGPVAWSTLGTSDAHSLAFDPTDVSRLYFGHHGGLLESRDGGRSWQAATMPEADAMNVRVAGGRLQIAGHEVYVESTDGGVSWQPVPSDLPGLDLHAFAVDPGDRNHAWAFAAGHGLFETTDAGRHYMLRQPGNWTHLAAFREDGPQSFWQSGRMGSSEAAMAGQAGSASPIRAHRWLAGWRRRPMAGRCTRRPLPDCDARRMEAPRGSRPVLTAPPWRSRSPQMTRRTSPWSTTARG